MTIIDISKLRLLDDVLFAVCCQENIPCTEIIIQTALNNFNIKIESVKIQYHIKSLQEHSVYLDVLAIDTKTNQYFNIEVQRSDEGADVKRARFHCSIIDSNLLKTSTPYSKLPTLYVIFITENDIFGRGLPIYKIERKFEDNNEPFGDGSHIIYINTSYNKEEETPLGKMIHDFKCRDWQKMKIETLKNRVKFFKTTEGGERQMGSMIDEITRQKVEEAMAKGRAEGRAEERQNILQKITNSLKEGQTYTSEDILHLLLKLQMAN